MLVALIGPPSAGKDTIANYLVASHFFTRVRIVSSRSQLEHSLSRLGNELRFVGFEDFLDYSTKNWQQDLVTTDLVSISGLEKFLKRPFFVLANVTASVRSRWKRFWQHHLDFGTCEVVSSSLDDFLLQDEEYEYGSSTSNQSIDQVQIGINRLGLPVTVSQNHPPHTKLQKICIGPVRSPLKSLSPFATYTITNNDSRDELFSSIDTIHLKKLRSSLRPEWDEYFMTLANLASLRSNCMKRRVGAVLITKRDKRVLSTGYNGTPRGMRNCNEGGCARCNGTLGVLPETSEAGGPEPIASTAKTAAEVVSKCGVDLNECLCLHAEENALLEAGRDRMGAGEGSTLYCNTCPCLRCSVKIVQCGIREVVYSLSYSMDMGTAAVFAEAGVQLRQISLP
ncbi:hypothetical protein CROQUDRAFT_519812 [Cronartium quercuum f. sp. fusiforme G11]|uniref:Deoxycytidylate deaminase n=1 Tax=Cronartium quercuum f. sp. fusiforme G11 TaxID=708437 RepID=A0A9P6T688_9BASI|nr:hypothetical protein CROQUDRAFT_519812 [Cronartium quercuum f. sp. fusiforme G11]